MIKIADHQSKEGSSYERAIAFQYTSRIQKLAV